VTKRSALRFVLVIGAVSFFADFTYEGSRSITGPYLAMLGASATVVGFVAGLGELLGYGLRWFSGRLSENSGKYRPITIFGYIVQMASEPLLSLAGSWPAAAVLIVTERIGKAIRNPPRDVMISHAAKEMGYGWGFGLHEALDQAGALVGPLLLATLLSRSHSYPTAFLALAFPAVATLTLLGCARWTYPEPEGTEPVRRNLDLREFPPAFWIYLAGTGLVAAGVADFALIAYHFQKAGIVPQSWIPIFYPSLWESVAYDHWFSANSSTGSAC